MSVHTVFIVPYRDMPTHKDAFLAYFSSLKKSDPEWSNGVSLIFAEQDNQLPFNRGAMKNIGAIAAKMKYPNDWGRLTLVFHDVDSLPRSPNAVNYGCEPGWVNHIYGNDTALGGIFSIRAYDFFRSGGFPNIWGWGYEDNSMTKRAKMSGLRIDRDRKIAIDDFTRIVRTDKAGPPSPKAVSQPDVIRIFRGRGDALAHVSVISHTWEGDVLKVHRFRTGYAPPRSLTLVPPEILSSNVIAWIASRNARSGIMRFAR